MPVQYDALLVAGLAAEIERRWLGAELRALHLDRTRRVARLEFRRLPRLVFLLHPTAGHIVADESGAWLDPGERRIGLRRQRLVEIHTEEDERHLRFSLGSGRSDLMFFLFVELHTNQWNAVLVSAATGTVADLLWARSAGSRPLRPGSPYRAPGTTGERRRLPSAREWIERLSPIPEEDRRGVALREFSALSRINVDALFRSPSREDSGRLLAAHARYLALQAEVGGSWLLRRPWGNQPYVSDLGEADAARAPTLLEAMARAARSSGALDTLPALAVSRPARDPASRPVLAPTDGPDATPPASLSEHLLTPEHSALRRALESRLERARRRSDALRREHRGGEDGATLRDMGRLLLAHALHIERGSTHVRLDDFAGGIRDIELDPALGVTQNAERLFREARKRERAAAELPALLAEAKRFERRLGAVLAEFRDSGMPEEEMWVLAGGRPETPAGREPVRLPYRRYRSSGGLEIRVGRGARANDDLIAHYSAPDDIWLHARQAPGAHVVLRWGRKPDNPPQRDLLEAATAAAVFSEARHSGTVAIDWTRRKYVRKPRKAKPGQVIIERAGTLFVQPDADQIARLRLPG